MSKNGRPKIFNETSRKIWLIRGALFLDAFWTDKVPKERVPGTILVSNLVKTDAIINVETY